MTTPDGHLADPMLLARWRRALLAKGGLVAKALEDLLAGAEVDLASLGVGKRGEDELIRTRRFLDRIDRAIKAHGTPKFGRCNVCGEPLPPLVLDEAPWTERCDRHPEA